MSSADAETGAKEPADDRVTFARRLSHDLRGPLNAMVLNLDLLRTVLEKDEVEEELAARRRRYLGAVQREIERMNELLTAALSEAKGEKRS